MGMLLFIASEIMFFFGFFWAFFHSSLNPSIWIGAIWPPIGITALDAWGIPFLNTIILLSSGFLLTDAHWHLVNRKDVIPFVVTNITETQEELLTAMDWTVILGIIFTLLQVQEYLGSSFSINSGIYGSVFFLLTGFHGFHVFIGTLLLSVCIIRITYGHFVSYHHVGFEVSAWYWHFVDVVWIFLFIFLYW
jgi:cytochrome c oxidase subunit 3